MTSALRVIPNSQAPRVSSQTTASPLLRVLVVDQALVLLIGALGAISPAHSDRWLRLFLVTEAALTVTLILWLKMRVRLCSRRILMSYWAATALALAIIARAILSDASTLVIADNVARIVLPVLLTILLLSRPELLSPLTEPSRATERGIILVSAGTVLVLVGTRLRGFGGAWLSGDPILPLLALPVLVTPSRRSPAPTMLVLLAVALSGKRLAILVWVPVLLAAVLWQRGTPLLRVTIGAIFALSLLAATGALPSTLERVRTASRLLSQADVSTATSAIDTDPSTGQRIEELRLLKNEATASPVNLMLGTPFIEYELDNGGRTHAIHTTPALLAAAGGIPLFLLIFAHRPSSQSSKRFPSVGIGLRLGAVVTIADSLVGNMALSPAFAMALCVLLLPRDRRT